MDNYSEKCIKIHKMIDEKEILTVIAEEASELAQAALKLRRSLGVPTNPTVKDSHVCFMNMLEEWADINVAMNVWTGVNDTNDSYIIKIMQNKIDRWLSRMEEKT